MPKKFCLFGDSKSTTFGLKLNKKGVVSYFSPKKAFSAVSPNWWNKVVGGWCTSFHVLKQLVFLVLTAEGWWYIRQSIDFALSPHDVMNYPNAPPVLGVFLVNLLYFKNFLEYFRSVWSVRILFLSNQMLKVFVWLKGCTYTHTGWLKMALIPKLWY